MTFSFISSIECVYCSGLGASAVGAKFRSMFRASKLHQENSNKCYKYNWILAMRREMGTGGQFVLNLAHLASLKVVNGY